MNEWKQSWCLTREGKSCGVHIYITVFIRGMKRKHLQTKISACLVYGFRIDIDQKQYYNGFETIKMFSLNVYYAWVHMCLYVSLGEGTQNYVGGVLGRPEEV